MIKKKKKVGVVFFVADFLSLDTVTIYYGENGKAESLNLFFIIMNFSSIIVINTLL